MELKLEDKSILELSFEANRKTGYDEITPVFTMFKKLQMKSKKPGFIREFTRDERTVINAIWEDLKKYELKDGNN
jgi:hypothetical protein